VQLSQEDAKVDCNKPSRASSNGTPIMKEQVTERELGTKRLDANDRKSRTGG
jgi:hypothetical protein